MKSNTARVALLIAVAGGGIAVGVLLGRSDTPRPRLPAPPPQPIPAPAPAEPLAFLDLVPGDTPLIAFLENPAGLIDRLGLSRAMSPAGEARRRALRAVEARLGFDPLDAEELRAAGLDPAAPAGITLLWLNSDTWGVLLTVADPRAFAVGLERLANTSGDHFDTSSFGEARLFVPVDEPFGAVVLRGRGAIFLFGPATLRDLRYRAELVAHLPSSRSLAAAPALSEFRSELGFARDGVAWIRPGDLVVRALDRAQTEALEGLQGDDAEEARLRFERRHLLVRTLLQDIRRLSAGLAFSKRAVEVEARLEISKDRPLRALLRNRKGVSPLTAAIGARPLGLAEVVVADEMIWSRVHSVLADPEAETLEFQERLRRYLGIPRGSRRSAPGKTAVGVALSGDVETALDEVGPGGLPKALDLTAALDLFDHERALRAFRDIRGAALGREVADQDLPRELPPVEFNLPFAPGRSLSAKATGTLVVAGTRPEILDRTSGGDVSETWPKHPGLRRLLSAEPTALLLALDLSLPATALLRFRRAMEEPGEEPSEAEREAAEKDFLDTARRLGTLAARLEATDTGFRLQAGLFVGDNSLSDLIAHVLQKAAQATGQDATPD